MEIHPVMAFTPDRPNCKQGYHESRDSRAEKKMMNGIPQAEFKRPHKEL